MGFICPSCTSWPFFAAYPKPWAPFPWTARGARRAGNRSRARKQTRGAEVLRLLSLSRSPSNWCPFTVSLLGEIRFPYRLHQKESVTLILTSKSGGPSFCFPFLGASHVTNEVGSQRPDCKCQIYWTQERGQCLAESTNEGLSFSSFFLKTIISLSLSHAFTLSCFLSLALHLPMYVLYGCLSIDLSIYRYIYLSYPNLISYIYLSICLRINLSIDLSICLRINLSIDLSIHLSNLSIHLSNQSIYPSIYLSIYQSIYLFIVSI